MQKVLKLVIKTYLFICLLNKVSGQSMNDDYLLLNEVIKLTSKEEIPPKKTYKLLKTVGVSIDKIEKYYKFKYFNEPIYRIIEVYDSEKDSIIYEDDSELRKREAFWKKKYFILDSLFSKHDIERMLERDILEIKEWDENRIEDHIEISKDSGLSFGNFINKPYYNADGKYAIVQHSSIRASSSFYIFKKEYDDWIVIGSIKNIW